MSKLLNASLAAVIGLGVMQASADDMSRRFLLVNHSDRTIVMVLASDVTKSSVDPFDLTGDETIRPGGRLIIEPVDDRGYCRFDIIITYRNGDRQEVDNANLCEIKSLITYGNAISVIY